jgi:hypothetical protein
MSTASNSVRTKTAGTGATAAVSTGWHRFKIVVNSNATSIQYFVDGTSIGTVTTNIPTATTRTTLGSFNIQKSAGTTNRTFKVDYFQYRNSLTTPR